MKKKIKELLKKIWAYADGNKTIFLTIVWGCIEKGLIPITGGWLIFVKVVVWALGGGAIFHHYKKGHFSFKRMKLED